MSQIFEQKIKIETHHLDVLGHVNNVHYVQWMQDIALAHSVSLGLGLEQYLELKHAMVASEHHVKYRKATFAGDELILRTWLGELNAFSSTRHYAFYRPKDKNIVFHAHTLWVCVEISNGRVKRLSPTFTQAYQTLDKNVDPMNFDVDSSSRTVSI